MKLSTLIIPLAICAAALAFSAIVYPRLPAVVPSHWDWKGEVDGHGSKNQVAFLLPVCMVGLLGLFQLLPWLSPKPFSMDGFRKTYDFIINVVMVFFAYMHVLFLLPGLGVKVKIDSALMVAMFLFFMLLGNVLGKVQRNLYVGIRTPWTLANDRVWADTHRLSAWIFVGMGVIGIGLILCGLYSLFTLPLILVGVLTTVVYSLFRYKQLERRGELGGEDGNRQSCP